MGTNRRILTIIFIVMSFSSVFSQGFTPDNQFMLNLDFARFRYNQNSGYLELYYGFYPRQITFQYNNQFEGGISLLTQILNKETNEYVVNESSSVNLAQADTAGAWFDFPFVTQAGFAIPYAEYQLKVIAKDTYHTQRADSIVLDLSINPYMNQVSTSDIEMCKNITSSQQSDDPFYKNGLLVIPFPTLVYGTATIPVVFHYIELYNLNPESTYKIKTMILDANGVPVRENMRQKQFTVANTVEVGTTPVTAYPSGRYTFRFSLLDDTESEIVRTDKTLHIYNPHIQVAQKTASVDMGVFSAMYDEELDREFQYAKYLALDEEKKMYEQLEGKEGKQKFLFDFWTAVEKGRRDKPPVSRSEYYRRITIANEKYGSFRHEGWATDRGRVVMVYGEPDEIDRHPQTNEQKRYEIWTYFSIENGVIFCFIDRLGTGRIELIHSTKRGEFYDPDWMRYTVF